MIVGFGVCGAGEAGRYMESTLKEFKRLCDKAVIIGNNIGLAEKKLIKKYGFDLIEDNREWGINQWAIKEDAINQIVLRYNADWIIALDMDEVFDKNLTRQHIDDLVKLGGVGYYFYVVNLYNDGYSKEWSFWNIRMFSTKYGTSFERKNLHPGLAPRVCYEWGNYAPFILKHYGLKEKVDRDRRVERYKKYDPQAKFKSKSYYDFLESVSEVSEFNEDKLHELVANEVKNYKHKIPKKMETKKRKFVYVRNPVGKIIDIPEEHLRETLKRGGFELVEDITTQQNTNIVNSDIDTGLNCQCGFVAKSKLGLMAHSRKHESNIKK